jgi:4-amino-4-deoxy-L-arabinose transferase-like glycosyltransferase
MKFLKRWQSYIPAISIFCLALLVRVTYNLTVARYYTPTHDSLFYYTIGLHILDEHCFCLQPHLSTVYRAPLWPAIIAGIVSLLGQHDYLPRYFLCLVGSGTCVLVYMFARDMFGWRIGLLAGAAAAIYPELYIYDGWLYTESLYIFLLLAFCYAVYQLQRNPRPSRWIWCGVLLGLSSLTRPNGLIVLGLFLLWALIMGWRKILSWRVVAKSAIFVTLITVAMITPWTIRNYNVSHAFVPVATGDGTVLLGAYNTLSVIAPSYPGGFVGSWINPLISTPSIANKFPKNCAAPCEVAREDYFKNAAVQWIKNNTRIMPHLLKLHLVNMWRLETYESDLPTGRFTNQRSTQLVLRMMKTFPIFVFILAALGLLVTWRRWREFLLIYFVILLTIAECIIFYGIPRFRAPIEPMLILLGAGAIWWMTHKEPGTMRWMLHRLRKQAATPIEASSQSNEAEVSSSSEPVAQ